MVNKPLTLPCSCSGHCPEVQWIRFVPDGTIIAQSGMCPKQQHSQSRYSVSGDTSRGDFSLTISSVAYNDAGSYMCSCNGQSVTEVKLKVIVYLLMEQCQAFIFRESMVNKPLTLPCSCSGNCPEVQWIRFVPDGTIVAQSGMCPKQQHSQSRYSVSGDTSRGDFSLTISSVAYNDAGSYMCSCNGQSVTEVKLKVIVYLLMEQCQAFIFRESMVNKPLTLPCSCSGNCPEVQWIRFVPDGTIVAQSGMCPKQQHSQSRYSVSGDTSRGDFSLTISSVAYNDAGSYMCSCNGQSVTEVKLKVIVPTFVKALEGENVTLPCYGDTQHDVKDVKWMKDGHRVLLYTPANRSGYNNSQPTTALKFQYCMCY
ncbi:hypothetical protein KOW79_011120 [Hemibagrus wyckioides]|uniref:Ig-like domain-containing protein n=1 Tax=Hemibagrus wyckioides TaxID=337641 RepID=A0A9D3NM03_9TELE|nr:hypothetical protein KOW79_011120 [Hemibagrus wyckioides]